MTAVDFFPEGPEISQTLFVQPFAAPSAVDRQASRRQGQQMA